jgi:hypothetical protein
MIEIETTILESTPTRNASSRYIAVSRTPTWSRSLASSTFPSYQTEAPNRFRVGPRRSCYALAALLTAPGRVCQRARPPVTYTVFLGIAHQAAIPATESHQANARVHRKNRSVRPALFERIPSANDLAYHKALPAGAALSVARYRGELRASCCRFRNLRLATTCRRIGHYDQPSHAFTSRSDGRSAHVMPGGCFTRKLPRTIPVNWQHLRQ